MGYIKLRRDVEYIKDKKHRIYITKEPLKNYVILLGGGGEVTKRLHKIIRGRGGYTKRLHLITIGSTLA